MFDVFYDLIIDMLVKMFRVLLLLAGAKLAVVLLGAPDFLYLLGLGLWDMMFANH